MVRIRLSLLLLGFLFGVAGVVGLRVSADTSTDLQSQIDTSNSQISALKAEIAQLQKDLNATTQQKQTLQSAVNELNLNIKKIQKSVALTQAQIKQQDLEINTLTKTISTTTSSINNSQTQVAGSLRELDSLDNQPLLVTLLGGGTLSSFFDDATTLEALRTDIEKHIQDLSNLKSNLETSKSAAQDKRQQLAVLNSQLTQQQQGLAIARDSQTKLLAQTKNQESTYQSQIAQKKALEAKFEQDLLNYENQLNLIVNPGSVPAPAAGVLSWPVDAPYITQYFGNTPFATQNPQIYGGKGHNAVDLRASPGTPIKAARDGTVKGVGNTDLTCPGASYGKWVFIEHDNGLSTLYAHLATYIVAAGDPVSRGQVIGYSDTTGYATGPHLHFGVYATSGSEIATFASKSCAGKIYTMPVANVSAYLNPLSYLPPL
jgi:murein DD-endopeptidase MepM/ murein hydrolase activator NlpD